MIIDTKWRNQLLNLLQVQTNSENEKLMVLYLDKELRKLKLKYCIDSVGNILVVKGDTKTYPCVVSHMDTVHKFVNNFGIYSHKKDDDILFAMNNKKEVGIGGDDKCGISACLYLLKVLPEIKVVFFSREEVGCRGSAGVNHAFFDSCRYIIQLDRRNNRDFIQTYCGKKTISHQFSSEIGIVKKKYNYKNASGTVTDVMRLWDNRIGISCINLSCGYYNPHMATEYISISDLWHSIKFTEEIIYTLKPKKYASLPPKFVTTWYNKCEQCSVCLQWKKEHLIYVVNGKSICLSCKHGQTIKENKGSTQLTKKDSNGYTCFNCGEILKKGIVLRSIGKHLYCKICADLFSPEFVTETLYEECQDCAEMVLEFETIDNKIYCLECAKTHVPSPSTYFCPTCKEILKVDEITWELEHPYSKICRKCSTLVQRYDDKPTDTKVDRICSLCFDEISPMQTKISQHGKEICAACAYNTDKNKP